MEEKVGNASYTTPQLMRWGKKRLVALIMFSMSMVQKRDREIALLRLQLDQRGRDELETPDDYVTSTEFCNYAQHIEERLRALERPAKTPSTITTWLKRVW